MQLRNLAFPSLLNVSLELLLVLCFYIVQSVFCVSRNRVTVHVFDTSELQVVSL